MKFSSVLDSNKTNLVLLNDEDINIPSAKVDLFKRVSETLANLPQYNCVTLRLGEFEFQGTPQLIGQVIFAHLNTDDWADEVTLKMDGRRYTYTTDPAAALIIW